MQHTTVVVTDLEDTLGAGVGAGAGSTISGVGESAAGCGSSLAVISACGAGATAALSTVAMAEVLAPVPLGGRRFIGARSSAVAPGWRRPAATRRIGV